MWKYSGSRFYKLTFYNSLSNLAVPLASIIDSSILNQLPDNTIFAGVSLAIIILDFLLFIFGFLRMGTTGITAQHYGIQDSIGSMTVLLRTLVLALAAGIAIVLMRDVLADLAFGFLKGEETVKTNALDYFNIRILVTPIVFCNFVFIGWFLGMEKSRYVLFLTSFASLIVVVMDYFFVLYKKMGSSGAAIANVYGQLTIFVLSVFILIYKYKREILLSISSKIFQFKSFLALFKLNRDIFFRSLGLMIAFTIFRNISSGLSAEILSANTIIFQLYIFVAYMIDGAAYATETLTGIHYGNNEWLILKDLLKLATRTGLLISLFFIFLIVIGNQIFLPLIIKKIEIRSLIEIYIFWLIPILVAGSYAFIFDGFFIGLTNGRMLRNTMVISVLFVFLPFSLLAEKLQNNHLLWFSFLSFLVSRGLIQWYITQKIVFKSQLQH